MQIREIIEKIRLMNSFPKIMVRMSGGPECKESFDYFTRPHLKYKVIQNKKWGIAMLELPNTFEEYLRSPNKQLLRRKRKRALANEFTFNSLKPLDHLNEIIAINMSTDTRQGRPMDLEYVNADEVQDFFKTIPEIFGIFDQKGTLQAYAHILICGEMFFFNRLLGHTAHLNNGIMYFLISEIFREMIEQKRSRGTPLWAMYDTFLGASEGLSYFKERLGFQPYNVKWIWEK